MSYQGARARVEGDEARRVFEISKVRLDRNGRVSDVLWAEINAKSNLDVAGSAVVPLADVIDAIHDGAQVSAVFPARFGAMADYSFQVIEFADGGEAIDLVGPHRSDAQARLSDLDRLDD